jgi:hypothetical protein
MIEPMTMDPQVATHPDGTERPHAPWQAVVLELFGSIAACVALLSMPLHYLSTRVTFFNVEAVVHDDDVRTYWVLVAVLVAGVVASFAGALWRRGRKAFVWHVFVAILGLVAALAFSVTQAGPVSELDHDRPEQSRPDDPGQHGAGVCRSGGDSDECLGG